MGGWNTLFGYAVWALMEYLLHDYLHYLVILVLSWPFAVLNAYSATGTSSFAAMTAFGASCRASRSCTRSRCAGLIALPILLRTLPFSIYVIQAGYTAVVVVLSYLSHKFFSFGGPQTTGVVSPGRSG